MSNHDQHFDSGGAGASDRRQSTFPGGGGRLRTQRKSVVGALQAETLKEKQARAREAREMRRTRISSTHKYLLDIVASYLDMDLASVEEFILDSSEQVNLMDGFLEADGSKGLMFFLQDSDPPGHESGRIVSIPKGSKMQRLFITSGREEGLTGKCMYFLRTTTQALTIKNVHDEVNFGALDTKQAGKLTVLPAAKEALNTVFRPALNALESWGDLSETPHGKKTKKNFCDSYENFIHFLDGAQIDVTGAVKLCPGEEVEIDHIQTAADCMGASTNPEIVEAFENLVHAWCKEIEQVIAESEQMRKEADDTGPLAELEHWRFLMSRFHSILDQVKSHHCRTVIKVLHAAKSKTLKQWRELDCRITDAANEAKDNVKYLYTLEKFCEPLYHSDPIGMVECIPSLINAIRMIHSISRYYNTSARMTSLFIKVTNQMVTACKNYITDYGMSRIWDQSYKTLIDKLQVSVKLYKEYQICFHKAKKKIEAIPEEKPFDFSEMYIFGKFDAFCKRIDKIIQMLTTIETYSVLTTSRIEGIEPMCTKFQTIFAIVKKKPYDILDHRKIDFDTDFEDFKSSIYDLEYMLQSFLDTSFERIPTAAQALRLLGRFQRLNFPCLNIDEKYGVVLHHFGSEIEGIKKLYNKQKDDPPIPRDMPPVAGKISWARQLFRKIEEPMDIIKEVPSAMKGVEAKKIVRNYNRTATVLMEFEIRYHRAWIEQIEAVKSGLRATLLIRHPETGQLMVNFDPLLYQIIRESVCMVKLGLDVPEAALVIVMGQDQLKDNVNSLKAILEENAAVRANISSIFQQLMSPHTKKVDIAIQPGLTMLSWTSLNLDAYFNSIKETLRSLFLLIKQVNDIRESRIDSCLNTIANTSLVELPSAEPWTAEDFISKTQSACEQRALVLDKVSMRVEEAVTELVEIFIEQAHRLSFSSKTGTNDRDDTVEGGEDTTEGSESEMSFATTESIEEEQLLQEECQELVLHFNHRILEALLKATRNALDSIKKRVFFSTPIGRGGSYGRKATRRTREAFFKVSVALAIPNVVLQPNLEDIQQALNKATTCVLEVSRGVAQWGQSRTRPNEPAVTFEEPGKHRHGAHSAPHVEVIPPQKLKNYYKSIADHKDIQKLQMMLSNAIGQSKPKIQEALVIFSGYQYLWEGDREESVKNFIKTEPILSEWKQEILSYQELESQIEEISHTIEVGAIRLYTEPIRTSLTVEACAWKLLLGRSLNKEYCAKMDEVSNFVGDYSKRLGRPIKDLDDVRLAMSALETIRQEDIRIDMTLGPIEEAYSMLQKFQVSVPREEANRVDSLRYSFQKLSRQASSAQANLVKIQPTFKGELLSAVETFHVDNFSFDADYEENGPMEQGISPGEANVRLQVFQTRFDDLLRRYNTYSAGEQLFGLPVTDYPALMKTKKELNLLQKLYGLYNDVIDRVNGYYDILWSEVDIDAINQELIDFQNRCRKLPKGLKEWQAFLELKKTIDDFNETCPLLELMANKAMKDRHWERITNVTGHKFEIDSDTFCLRNIMEAPLLRSKEDIEDICISAVKEKDIEAKLAQVVSEWTNQALSFSNFKARGELLLKGAETSEIVALMEDSLMVLGSLLSNRYNAPFKKKIQTWVQKLSNSSDIIENWMTTQNLWVYLEAVFVGGDIAKQLPQEAKRFSNIDKSWVKIMIRAHENDNVITCCVGDETLGQLLPHLLEQLEICQKSLTGYLEKKRLVFPRFFFVSDPALLEILGQASDSHTIQAHLLGVFENVNEVEFHAKDYDRIMSCVSREGEVIPLDKPVIAKGNVETWLGELLDTQMRSLHGIIKDASRVINDSSFELLSFLNNYIAQVGLLGIQMLWTRDAEEALSMARADKKIMPATNIHFLELLNCLIQQTTHDLTKVERIKYETLVTIHVHQRDIFNDLVAMHIRNVNDFEWLKQARFYFKEDTDQCIVSITDVDFSYQNEFLGCTDRLVITPLTDRCYITLAQALGMSMGGAPAGPAGTGKTETTKDMGKALGKYVVVFNCSDQMDYRGLGRIYKGLAQSGSWGCFDEFNRIELPVLSVAAQQIAIVLTAKKERKKEFVFMDGDVVDLNPEFGLFLTMNPGYAGRQELPENLKIQFRSVAMMVPDRQIIMRVKLASCGFQENVLLAQKFYTLYKLCEEQLTKQVHYDFGLRNILSVLRTLGANKRARPEDSESTIVMRVLRDMNLSKLVDEDEPLFLSLISDLFPGIQLDSATYEELQAALSVQVDVMNLVNHPAWNLKVVQLYETQRVRHGMMTLGPSGAGKTCCINLLMKAMGDCGAPHREMKMNPKAITAPQMFGRLDVATNDWTDGIFSTLWRKTLKAKKGEHIWIVLDGPVDAIWIENLNSVLDDNRTLTLANGDRIPMSPNCKVVFEVHNIDNASPATVSRNGMVYMSSSALDWRPILQSWLNKRAAGEASILHNLFHNCFDDIYMYVSHNLLPKMETLECNYIKQAVDLLEGLIPKKDEHDHSTMPAAHLEKLFIFAVMWSLGALLELEDRARMEEFMTQHESKMDLPPVTEESGHTIFEYVVTKDGTWEHWSNRVQEYLYPDDSVPEYSSILVPNVDNVCTNFLMEAIAKQHKAVLLIGEQGTAKTVMIKGYMSNYNPDAHVSKSFNFSSATIPMMFQRTIESYVDKRMGSTYGPPAGRKMTVFVDDINMPIINEWGDQVTNEIVRQMMEMHGMYSLEKPGDFTNIVDVQFIGAMIQPGGGRNDIPQRLKRQFSIFNCTLPSNASIDKIFGIIGSGYFCPTRFGEEVMELIKELVPVTRVLWQQTKVKMLPTPAKFHYIFNLRDLSRIWQGMLHIAREECSDQATVLALWKHECTRVIADRFTTEADKKWFENATSRVLNEQLGKSYVDQLAQEPYFVDFLRDPPEPTGEEAEDANLDAPKINELVPDLEFLSDKLQQYMSMYNDAIRGAHMDLVFFKDAMTHLVKISRIIRTDRGSALLVGVGGSGKQSLTRLATFIAGYKIFQITLTRSYNTSNLMDDLKYLYRVAGAEGHGITFIFTDNEIKDEAFLEYLNNVLSSGEVSNLFAKDELDEITQELISVMKKEFPRRPPTNDNLYDYFISRACKNLHIVLCFSPVGEKFRNRSLKFPGLISGCTMDWFTRWPKDALIAVSNHFLSKFEIICPTETKFQVVQTMGEVHDGVATTCIEYFERYRRQAHVTPKSYLSFLDGYKSIYLEKYSEISELAQRMNTGLDKLIEASESVAELSIQLVVKEKELEIASKKADLVLAEVTVSAQAAEKVKASVQVVKDKAQHIVTSIEAEKSVAEGKLEAARPALEEAENALNTIKPTHISTVRKLAKPPHLIMRIMDSVLILFQKRVDPPSLDPERPCPKPSWGESLKLMSGGGFLNALQTFAKDSITGETVELLHPYLSMEDYSFANAKKVCGDVAGLCSWTCAMATFFGINKEVLPLKANLAVQEAKLNIATRELEKAQGQLDEKQRELDEVQAKFDAAMLEKQTLLADAESCRHKMTAASALINGLGGEKIRWTQQSKEFKSQINRLVGDVLLATGFLSYSGPFNQVFRLMMMDEWSKELSKRRIPFSANLNVTNMLVDAPTIGEWNLQGLPNDELSIQNGIIVTKATRYPLLIDPQGQGKVWIKNRESDNGLQVTSLNHKYFRTHLEDALSLGRPLYIEDVGEDLDPALDNVLEKNFIKSGSTFKVKVGDKECDVMTGFTLYMTTKLANPTYTPEVSAKASIIDFTVTMKGLEDQLLGRVIQTEKQELESERIALMEDVTANKRKMKELEDNLLYRLTSTQGSLVEDESLITVLASTKVTSEEVTEKLVVAADTELKINEAREEFRPVANRGSILYFLITEMSMVNVMYQTSLKQFLGIFDLSMARSEKSPIPAKRIANIISQLTYEVFRYSCRGLYENHKFLFTLLIALKIDQQLGNVRIKEFQTLIKGGAALDLKACPPKPSKWITDVTWLNLVELSKLPQYSEILTQIQRNERTWKVWFDKDAPEEEIIPDGYNSSLDTFRKLLLIRSWCTDRTIPQARKYIADSMGSRYADPVILDLEKTWEESDVHTPLICFLSMGSDPTSQIEGLGKKLKVACRSISMGQGQEVHARRLIHQSQVGGGWVMLQNCHLGLEFMDELLDTVTGYENPHASFRVWITTEVHPQFPISLLQASIKFTNEPPQGMKAGLKRTFASITQDQLDVISLPHWKPMLYGVAFLHTCVQERRKFGPLGWNIPYEFNSADQAASVQFVQNHLDDIDPKKGVSWNTVRYMLGEVQYGGRVTDDYDKRLLNTFAKVWFGDHMFQESFKFYTGYIIPKCKTVHDFLEVIETLPLTDSPEVFGLHPNADITYQSNTAKEVLDTILNIQPKDTGGGSGETRESIVYKLAQDMLEKLPPGYIPHEVKARLVKMGALTSMNIFLRQELDRMQRVISLVRTTLTDLRLAIEGTIIMSENLRDALDNMYDARVPALWKKVSWESSTLGFWFTELIERNGQFFSWCFEGRPCVFWMTGFFNPQGFLTAMRQEVTRAHKGWALDSVTLHNDVTKSFKEEICAPPNEGVYVHGLYLDGAGWDRRGAKLTEPTPKVLFTLLPVIHMFAINSTAPKDPRLYQCPVYKKPCRTDLTFITFVILRTTPSPDHWTLRGVALLCDTK
ncbi:dynein heavy chain 8, axonemal [Strongylocentrotus purpuratus]|uniref:AAA+ ATPase domain-containing protein n=1 Tax=Strongylocentrotus purpuratus TaxID=7668 RepID=A0A7M7NA31_STRPU|nr:dynein heavy chain 8, axonemal [Strongylocentrotus purpuratus]